MTDETTNPADLQLTDRDLCFNFRSGALSLHLVETFGEWTRRRYDRILNGAVWNQWLEIVGLPPLTRLATNAELGAMRDLRRAIYGLGQSRVKGITPLPADVRVINQFAALPAPAITLDDSALKYAYTGSVTQDNILSLIARDAVELFGGQYATRIRECASHICPVIFVDRSRRGDRLWCSTNCGARHATARYRKRLQSDN
ncbi:CGNR zinc finger domain-containing protein [Silvibacterium sp.]|uniref:CGNR zinc finger domain-containing protein n=1 Tax=Silvibacterium sp. TaxID=1964179 RepID=UPI0039E2D5EC